MLEQYSLNEKVFPTQAGSVFDVVLLIIVTNQISSPFIITFSSWWMTLMQPHVRQHLSQGLDQPPTPPPPPTPLPEASN